MEKEKKASDKLEDTYYVQQRKRYIKGEDEIDLVEVAKTIWSNRKTIFKSTVIFIILGLIIAFGSRIEYEASCKLLPDTQGSKIPNFGGLSGLAGLAGINIDVGNQGALSPELYPQIVHSLPFQLSILNKELRFEKKDTIVSSYVYFKEIYSPSFLGLLYEFTLGLPGKIKGLFSEEGEKINIELKDGIIRLNKEDDKFIQTFKERIRVEVDSKTGIITLSTEMPDPIASAELAKLSVDLLQQYVIDYKISKAKENLDFIMDRYKEAKTKFEKAQINLAAFNDRNQNVVTARALTDQQRLQNEYNLAFEVYQGLATQLEQAEIKVKEDTPVFTLVEPVRVPVEKSTPQRKLILAMSIVLGALVGIMWIFLSNIYRALKKSIES